MGYRYPIVEKPTGVISATTCGYCQKNVGNMITMPKVQGWEGRDGQS